jgi:pre-mRNA-processing factor 40
MDDQYLIMLGNPGSNPLKLFWDIVDALDQKLDAKIAVVEDAIKRHNAKLQLDAAGVHESVCEEARVAVKGKGENDEKMFEVGPEMTEEEFTAVIKADIHDAVEPLNDEDLHNVFDTVSALLMWPCGC